MITQQNLTIKIPEKKGRGSSRDDDDLTIRTFMLLLQAAAKVTLYSLH